MATVDPFRGVRYNLEKAGELADLVTPPYDVIDQESQEAFYRRNRYNIIRLEYGKKYDQDDAADNRYTRAAGLLKKWKEDGVLVKDEDPALYLYQQEFEVNGVKKVRTGFICIVKLEPYESGVILPHEETIPKHKADRLELMRACRANFSPVFALFADRDRKVDRVLLTAAGGEPDMEFKDGDGQIHRLWVITHRDTISRVQELMSDQRIFIADGHHRYETALAYRDERRKTGKETGEVKPYDYIMMTLVNLYDPGLIILPTHRLVKNVREVSQFLSRVEEIFTVEKIDTGRYCRHPEQLEDLLRTRANFNSGSPAGHDHVFALYTGNGQLYLLTLKNHGTLDTMMPANHSRAWNRLDVSILQNLVLDRYLGIGYAERAAGDRLKYTRNAGEVFAEVDSGNFSLGILMNPTMMEELIMVASEGEKMPQKSTYFYPKLITGLVINEL